jgi:hypothetical protein
VKSDVQPGDLVDISKRLRAALSAHDNASFALAGSFLALDYELEAIATQLRPAVDDTAALICSFLERLERTKAFETVRTAHLKGVTHGPAGRTETTD